MELDVLPKCIPQIKGRQKREYLISTIEIDRKSCIDEH